MAVSEVKETGWNHPVGGAVDRQSASIGAAAAAAFDAASSAARERETGVDLFVWTGVYPVYVAETVDSSKRKGMMKGVARAAVAVAFLKGWNLSYVFSDSLASLNNNCVPLIQPIAKTTFSALFRSTNEGNPTINRYSSKHPAYNNI